MREPLGRFRLRATMTPMEGQPVQWNARAVIWSGSDRRYYARQAVSCLSAWLRRRSNKASSRTYRVHLWLFRCVDDRDQTYSGRVCVVRRVLNTQADVEARKAWAETNRYWQAQERQAVRG